MVLGKVGNLAEMTVKPKVEWWGQCLGRKLVGLMALLLEWNEVESLEVTTAVNMVAAMVCAKADLKVVGEVELKVVQKESSLVDLMVS